MRVSSPVIPLSEICIWLKAGVSVRGKCDSTTKLVSGRLHGMLSSPMHADERSAGTRTDQASAQKGHRPLVLMIHKVDCAGERCLKGRELRRNQNPDSGFMDTRQRGVQWMGVQWMSGMGGEPSRTLTQTFETQSVSQIQIKIASDYT